MKRLTLCCVLTLALAGGIGCNGANQQFVGALDAAFKDYRPAADAAIDRDPTLTDARKKALKAESDEIQRTIDAAKEDK